MLLASCKTAIYGIYLTVSLSQKAKNQIESGTKEGLFGKEERKSLKI
jgi:hypothetical protein